MSRPWFSSTLGAVGALLFVATGPVVAQTVYWTDFGSGKIQRRALPAGATEDLVTTQADKPVGLALDLVNGKMYWTEETLADFMISRANLDGSNVQYLITHLTRPSGIAVDPLGGKLYWTDRGANKVQRANLNGTAVETLVTAGVVEPLDIALDRDAGKMYWTELNPAGFMIRRANLDGSAVEGLVSGLSEPGGIALDPAAGRMYWADRGAGRIQRARLDGTQLEDVVTTGLIEPVRLALDLAARKIYWTEASFADFMISRANLDGTNVQYFIEGLSSPSGIALDAPPCPGDRGDADCNANVDFFDIDPFLLALFDLPTYQATYCGGSICAADVDGSGGVDFFDIDAFVACLFGTCL